MENKYGEKKIQNDTVKKAQLQKISQHKTNSIKPGKIYFFNIPYVFRSFKQESVNPIPRPTHDRGIKCIFQTNIETKETYTAVKHKNCIYLFANMLYF